MVTRYMSRDFTSWEDTLVHYGVPGMKKGFRKDSRYENKTKQLIAEKQAEMRHPLSLKTPAVLSNELGSYQKDKAYMQKHGIPSAYLRQGGGVTFKEPKEKKMTPKERLVNEAKSTDPQEILKNKRRNTYNTLKNAGRRW